MTVTVRYQCPHCGTTVEAEFLVSSTLTPTVYCGMASCGAETEMMKIDVYE